MINLSKMCPKCSCEITFKSKDGYNNSLKNNSVCRKCASSGENNGMFGKIGEKNPFFGKTHSKETLEKQSKIKLGKKHSNESIDKIRDANIGDKNKMFGKTFYEVWVEKYGKEVADEKLKKFKIKQSENNSGEKNSMYGKPSPTGSGNGWSGWYKGWYFRSLRELTFMIRVIERFNFNWVCCETTKFNIMYVDYKGLERNYYPDFLLNNKYLVEIKPKKLWSSNNVIRKTNSAIEYCKNMGYKYKLMDVGMLNLIEMKKLHDEGLIKFIERYEIKYKEKYGK